MQEVGLRLVTKLNFHPLIIFLDSILKIDSSIDLILMIKCLII